MKPHCVRQICRSRNPYSPSIVLWQHFVQPCQLRQQRLFSSETETTPSSAPNAEILPSPPAPTPDDAPEIEHNEQQAKRGPTRKVLDKKGMHEFTSPRQASMHKNANARAEQSTVAAHDILLKTKTAYDKSEDYEGVVVEAILASRAPAEKLLPWCVPRTSGDERRSEDR
jgi:non-canonical poly(A) RNA polymerase PAPD5/7